MKRTLLLVAVVGAALLWLLGGCVHIPRAPVVPPSLPLPRGVAPVVPPSLPLPRGVTLPGTWTNLIPDTSESYWYVGALAAACFSLGVVAVVASFFGIAIGVPTVGGGLRKAGLSCIILSLGIMAVGYFLHAYFRVVVFLLLVMGLCALAPLVIVYGRLAAEKLKAKWASNAINVGIQLANSGDARGGVAAMSVASPEISAVRKDVLALIEQGHPAEAAISKALNGAARAILDKLSLAAAQQTVDSAKTTVEAVKAAPADSPTVFPAANP